MNVEPHEYRIVHRAPGFEEDGTTVRLDLIGTDDEVFPSDVMRHPDRYGAIHPATIAQVRAAAGKEDFDVEIFRAVPRGVTTINPGDWVALSRAYAESESLMESAVVITATVKASTLWSEGLLEEWGYQGPETSASIPHQIEDLNRSRADQAAIRAAFPINATGTVRTTHTTESNNPPRHRMPRQPENNIQRD